MEIMCFEKGIHLVEPRARSLLKPIKSFAQAEYLVLMARCRKTGRLSHLDFLFEVSIEALLTSIC